MRKNLVQEQMVLKFRLSARDGCRVILFDDMQNQFRRMEVMEGKSRQERIELIKKNEYRVRKRLQREGFPYIRIWASDAQFQNFTIGGQICDGSEDAKNRLKGDLEIDRKKRDGVVLALDERANVAEVAGVLTRGEVKRYQLIGGKEKRTKLIKK